MHSITQFRSSLNLRKFRFRRRQSDVVTTLYSSAANHLSPNLIRQRKQNYAMLCYNSSVLQSISAINSDKMNRSRIAKSLRRRTRKKKSFCVSIIRLGRHTENQWKIVLKLRRRRSISSSNSCFDVLTKCPPDLGTLQ